LQAAISAGVGITDATVSAMPMTSVQSCCRSLALSSSSTWPPFNTTSKSSYHWLAVFGRVVHGDDDFELRHMTKFVFYRRIANIRSAEIRVSNKRCPYPKNPQNPEISLIAG
jgi:hypothetical protein